MKEPKHARSGSREPRRERIGPRPAAGRLLIAGVILLALATCDFAARLMTAEAAGALGAIHRLSDFGGSISASAVIFTAAGLGLDYLERGGEDDER